MLNFSQRSVPERVSVVVKMRQRFWYFANGSASAAVVLALFLGLSYGVWMVFNSELNYAIQDQRSHQILNNLHRLFWR